MFTARIRYSTKYKPDFDSFCCDILGRRLAGKREGECEGGMPEGLG